MATHGEPLLGDDPRQRVDQSTVTRLREAGANLCLMLSRDGHDLVEHLPSLACQSQCIGPSVGPMGSSLQETATLELVDYPDDPARRQTKLVSQGGLRSAFLGRDVSQNEGRPGIESNRSESLVPPLRRVGADLREKVGGAWHPQASGGGLLSVSAHGLPFGSQDRGGRGLRTMCKNYTL
jgi:hypothetical protein